MVKDVGKRDLADPLVPAKTPFGYNVGINYESWEVGRTGYSITADLDQIYDNFRLIRTYHDAGFDTTPVIDGTQAQVIDWVVGHPGTELVMGTNISAVAQLSSGTWSAGLMSSGTAYTDLWVDMLIDAFGSVAKVKAGLRAVILGNELDMNGPPPTDPNFSDYVDTWIPAAFDNLKASLAAKGLGSIPITTSIANYGASNEVSVKVPGYIVAHWSSAWNNGEPFVMFDQYTPDNQQSTDFGAVEAYFEAVEKALGSQLEVFVGETGYSTDWGTANQKAVYEKIVTWLKGMYSDGGKTVPLFAFMAFDRPAYADGEIGFGIYGENSQSQPTGLKSDLDGVLPGWTTAAITSSSKKSDVLYGGDGADRIKAKAGDDIVLGLGGRDELFGQSGSDLIMSLGGRDRLFGGRGDDCLDGGSGRDVLSGGAGENELRGDRGGDIFVLDANGTARILDFTDGADRIGLKDDLRFGKLDFTDAGGHTEIRSGSGLVAVVENANASLFGKDDFFQL